MQTHTVILTGQDSLIASPLTIGELIQVMAITEVYSLVSKVGDGLAVKVTLITEPQEIKSIELKFSGSDREKETLGRVVGITPDMGDTSNE